MANVKTAISMPESLFEQAELMARELKVSRSQLLALALAEFIQRHQNKKLLEQINAACEELSDEEEAVLVAMRRQQQQMVAEEW